MPAELAEGSVRAIAFGATSKAVVDIGGTTKIVAPGDYVNGMRVQSILSDRVVLAGGLTLRLTRRLP
jgi:hypothetical protein